MIIEDYHKQYQLQVKDNGSLNISNSFFTSLSNKWFNFNYYDNACIHISNFKSTIEYIPWHYSESSKTNMTINFYDSIVGVTLYNNYNGILNVYDSSGIYFEILIGAGTYDYNFPSGHINYFKVPTSSKLGTVQVFNSIIYEIDTTIWPGARVTIRNNLNSKFAFGWINGKQWYFVGDTRSYSNNLPIYLSSIKNGYYADQTWLGDNSSLRLVNSRITNGFWPVINGNFNLSVFNSDLIDPWSYDTSRMIVKSSTINYVTATDSSNFLIENSIIHDSIVALKNSTVSCTGCTFSGQVSIGNGAKVFFDGQQSSQ